MAVKRSKDEQALVVGSSAPTAPARTSTLAAPIMLLKGHADAVNTMRFSPDGEVCASGGHDR